MNNSFDDFHFYDLHEVSIHIRPKKKLLFPVTLP